MYMLMRNLLMVAIIKYNSRGLTKKLLRLITSLKHECKCLYIYYVGAILCAFPSIMFCVWMNGLQAMEILDGMHKRT